MYEVDSFNPLTKRGTVEGKYDVKAFGLGTYSFNPLTKRGTVEERKREPTLLELYIVSIPSLSGAQWRPQQSKKG